jgi:lysophospholipase L1-like esterase
LRKHFTLALLFVATFVPALATPAAARPANGNEDDGQGILLGLGDSVAFGYDPLVVAAGKAGNPKNFVGYPDIAARRLELRDANAACPGEASGGFIKLTGPDNGCRLYRYLYPLHVNYTTSQFDYSIKFLKAHQNVELVTMSIGANDLFLLQKRCNGDPVCEIKGLGPTLDAMQANLSFVYGQVRNTAHYQGDLVTLTYYAPNADPLVAFALTQLNDRLTIVSKAFSGITADGFGAFKTASAPFGGDACKAGLLIVTAPGVCDVHPSPKGRNLLAGAVVTAVNNAQIQQARLLARR